MKPSLHISSLILVLAFTDLVFAQVRINELSAGRSDRLLNWQNGVARIGSGPTWYQSAYADDYWSSGPGGFGYGDGDDATVLNTDMQGVTPSLYLRKVFTVSGADAGRNDALELIIDYDDGFVAYLNGKEIARKNLGAPGAFVYRDQVAYNAHEAGTPEILTLGIASDLLVTGENLFAIQVHNEDAGNDDLSLIADLKITAPDTALVSSNETWKYFVGVIEPSGGFFDHELLLGSGAGLSVTWGQGSFNDAPWDSGPGPLGYEANIAMGTDLQAELSNEQVSLYVRQAFTVSAATAASPEALELTMDYDDGFVAYLNGIEVARSSFMGVPGTFISHTTTATGNRESGAPETIVLSPASAYLNEGVNVLAIQAHNVALNSSDLVIIADLDLAGPNPEALVDHTDQWKYFVGSSEPSPPPEDEDLDSDTDFPDWIELANTSGNPVDLTDWTLSDDASQPAKWTFPGITLAPGEHRVVFCTERNLINPARAFLHTNFRLDMGGETLALYNNAAQLVSEIGGKYPDQHLFYSYGWDTTAGAYRYFDSASPGAANAGATFTEIVKKPKFDPDPGFYASPLVVTVSVSDVSASMYYTTDGSVPSVTNGTLVVGPITLNSSASLRARSFKAGAVPSKTVTRSYLLDQPAAVIAQPAIIITGHEPQAMYAPHGVASIVGGQYSGGTWSATGPDDYNIPMERGRSWERQVSFEVINAASNEWVQVDAGMRMSGSSYTRPRYVLNQVDMDDRWDGNAHKDKPQFNMFFRKVYGAGRLDYALMPNSSVTSFDGLRLRGGKNDFNNPFIRDELMRRLFINTGQPGSPGVIANLYYNGEYKSYYNPAARYINAFFQDAYKSSYDWDIMNHGGLSDGTQDFWNEARTFRDAASTDLSDLADYQTMLTYVDPENFADYLIVNTYGSTWDWPHNNWYAARERSPTGRYGWYIWDAEGGFTRNAVTYDSFVSDLLNKSSDTPRYYTELVQSSEWRMLFADRVYQHFFNGGPLSDASIWGEYTYLKDRFSPIRLAIKGGGMNGSAIENYINARRVPYFDQLRNQGLWPDTLAPDFTTPGGQVAPGSQVAVTHSNVTGIIYYTIDGSDPRAAGGLVAGTAYAGPITLDQSRDIKARVLESGEWSPLAIATYITDLPSLVITEIMYNPVNPDAEFIELKNIGTDPVELGGLSFEGFTFSFPPSPYGTLAPGGYLVVAKNPPVFATFYNTNGMNLAGPFLGGSLSNGGEELALVHSTFGDIQRFDYKDGWYPQTDGAGFSLTIRDELADSIWWDDKAGWRASDAYLGTPGGPDPGLLPLPDSIVINEVLTHTDASPVGDWIELHNRSGDNLDIGGWFLSDNAAVLSKFRIPDNTIIPAGGFLVFDATNHFRHASAPLPFGLSEHGENVYLNSALPGGTLTGYLAARDFDVAEKEVTIGRYTRSDGKVDFTAMSSATSGLANSAPRVGPVVFSEIMYNPLPGQYEFIELVNITAAPVPMFDPAVPTNTWSVSGVGFDFPLGITLAANELLVLAESTITPAAFRALHGIAPSIRIFSFPGSLSNGGESLRLQKPGSPDETGVPDIDVDRVVYEDKAPWAISADGAGPSLDRNSNFDYGNDPANWPASAGSGGTPGSSLPYRILTASVNPGGTITPLGNVQVALGGGTNYVITVSNFYHLADVILDGNTSLGPVFNYTFSNVTGSHTLHAVVLPDTATQGTPHWWLNASNPSWVDNFDVHEVSDSDNDGTPAWKEYLGDSDPGDALSEFVMEDVSTDATAQLTLRWNSRQLGAFPTPRQYAVYRADGSFSNGSAWTQVVGGLNAQGDSTTVVDDLSLLSVDTAVYRVMIDGVSGSYTEAVTVAQRLRLTEGRNFVSIPFEPLDNTLAALFPVDQLPAAATESAATVIDLWDAGSQNMSARYFNSSAPGFTGWRVPGSFADANTVPVDRAQGVIITVREGAGSMDLYGAGWLPETTPSVSVVDNGYTLLALPIPSQIYVASLGLPAAGFVGGTRFSASDRLLFFNPATGRFDIRVWLYAPNQQWLTAELTTGNRAIQPGESFLIQRRDRGSAFNWSSPLFYSTPAPGPQ